MAARNRIPKKDNLGMPPPPLPQKKILEGEVNALGNCFRSAVVKTGQVYSFYADTQRLGINQFAPNPPRSLTGSLGREVEKFDQLCDAIGSRLIRATAVLKRDLIREENRLRAAQAVEPVQSRPPSPTAGTVPSSPSQLLKTTEQSPPQSAASGRRQSVISLSSLHRPTFQHKLDLSSLRLIPEDLITLTTGGLASPVTLAPKSARPPASDELPPDLMAALASSEAAASHTTVDIDLTLDSDAPEPIHQVNVGSIDHTLGSSADKPIELDLDMDMSDMQEMSNIFDQNTNGGVEGLFSRSDTKKKGDENIGMEILDAFSSVTEGSGNSLFASMDTQHNHHSSNNMSSSGIAPSPGSILASFNEATNGTDSVSASIPGGENPFDLTSIDLASIDHTFLMASNSDMNLMEELFKVEGDSNVIGMETSKNG